MHTKVLLIAGTFIIILILAIIIIDKTYTPEWQELPCGLWINKNGDIAFKSSTHVSEEEIVDYYITQVSDEHAGLFNINLSALAADTLLKNLVDTATFHRLSHSSFYKDKKHIYVYVFNTFGGGFYPIDGKADYATFEYLGDEYSRDKNHIYCSDVLDIVDGADYETFQAIDLNLAKDKNGFFHLERRITEDEAKKYLKN